MPNNMYQEVPRLSTFSGTVGKEAPFSQWHYELMCLVREHYPDTTIMSAIRKSLRSPTADVLRRLGDDTGPDQVLRKFQDLYGRVQEGDTLLQQFYGEKHLRNPV